MKVPILLPNIFNHPFTYESDLKLKVGDYVVVPFGKSKITGVVWDEFEKKNNRNFKIKNVLKKLDVTPLKKTTIKFLNWFSEYNIIPKGMALKLVLRSSNAVEKIKKDAYKIFDTNIKKNSIKLSEEQKKSLKKMNVSNQKFRVHVLQGTTGSGKTMVYFEALKAVNLEIKRGEILALLGPNVAGKTTLISTICGIISPSSGSVTVDGFDIISDFRKTRSMIGLVPQELTLGSFDTVWSTVRFSRGLFGSKRDDAYLEQLLKDLSLFDKKDSEIRALSGGMKRRVLIAKALSHQPKVLFLDEPTAGVDVELRKEMWKIVHKLSKQGVTIILTTHYIEEAEEIAERVGVISNGELLLVEKKDELMESLGKKQLIIDLKEPVKKIPSSLKNYNIEVSADGMQVSYTYVVKDEEVDVSEVLHEITNSGLLLKDLKVEQSSLEDIFVDLVKEES